VPHRPMENVRVLEVAQFSFVPTAGAVLADWGADVVKVEHAVTGDAQRGSRFIGQVPVDPEFSAVIQHANRGKRSIGLALEHEGALEVLYRLVARSDVFLTNFLPAARRRLRIEADDIQGVNPAIIYVRGSAFGNEGPDREKGGYDFTAFWSRAGNAASATPATLDEMVHMPGPAWGDSMGGMTIAGGIAAALFARERTGEASVLDVSLLGVGVWAAGLAIDMSLLDGEPWHAPTTAGYWSAPKNPISGNYRTRDGRWLVFHMSQLGRYWEEFCTCLGRPELRDPERFGTVEDIMANTPAAAAVIKDEIGKRTLDEWTERFGTMEGAWAIAQDSVEVARDPQVRANGHIAPVVDALGRPRELVASPVRFDATDPSLTRGPEFAEHTDEILRGLGYDDDQIIELKIEGAVT
jgi:crotonobetainyl-CoA:carnitine CoA-transferase CaiB-like acyl-CoA transferase